MKSVRWLGPLLDMSGYAAAGRNYVKALDLACVPVQVRCRSRSVALKNFGLDGEIVKDYNRLYLTRTEADTPVVQHNVPDSMYRIPASRMSFGCTMFEMTTIPDGWVKPCSNVDEIWTPSEYSKAAFVNSGVTTPIRVVPLGIDTDLFSPDGPCWTIANRRRFAFISVFDFTERKAWKEMLRAYWHAFGADDDVCLVLKVFYSGFSPEARAEVVRKIASFRLEIGMENRAPVLIYGHDIPNEHMPSLYRAADCYVGISREGFGLPYAEAMACGLACIGPEVGGNRVFMDDSNSFLVEYVGDEDISEAMVRCNGAFAGLRWSVHSWEDLSAVMKRVVSDSSRRKEVAKLGLEHVRDRLGLGPIGHTLREIIPE